MNDSVVLLAYSLSFVTNSRCPTTRTDDSAIDASLLLSASCYANVRRTSARQGQTEANIIVSLYDLRISRLKILLN